MMTMQIIAMTPHCVSPHHRYDASLGFFARSQTDELPIAGPEHRTDGILGHFVAGLDHLGQVAGFPELLDESLGSLARSVNLSRLVHDHRPARDRGQDQEIENALDDRPGAGDHVQDAVLSSDWRGHRIVIRSTTSPPRRRKVLR